MGKPTIAILGRPNVGKSTLFNRLIGRRHAIVSPVEGVTRDRIYGNMDWTGHNFRVIDTGGYLPESEDIIEKAVRLQAELATEEADFIILLVDGRAEPTSSDRFLAQHILKSEKPYILVTNKIDDGSHEMSSLSYYELGLGEPISISAVSGRSVGDMLDVLVEKMPKSPDDSELDEDVVSLAIIGMPNVGKSSLMNALLKEEKSIVTNIAGTTRDSVDSYIRYYNKTYRLIDTAGLRRKAKIGDSIEYYSSVRTQKVIEDCDIAIVLLDAEKGFGNQDRDVVRNVIDHGRGLVVAVNKWDTIEKETRTLQEYKASIELNFKNMEHYPVIFMSVLENKRTWEVMRHAAMVFEEYQRRIKTSDLNEFINKAVENYHPPAVKSKHLKIKYATQVHSAPPVFALFTNYPELFPVSYRRYLENQIRKEFGFKGVPIKISFRKK